MSITFHDITRRDLLAGTSKAAGGVLLISAGLGASSAHAAIDTTKFLTHGKIAYGIILPLSGAFTIVSQPWIRAIQWATEEINAAGGVRIGGKSYEVFNPIGDERYSAAGGLSAFKKMVAENVHYTGGYVSVEAPQAVQGINVANDVLMIEGITGKDLCLTDNELRFYEYSLAQATGPYIADYAFNILKARKVAAILLNNTWGVDFYKSFAATFQELGGEIADHRNMQISQTDYSAEVTDWLRKKVDLLYIIIGDGPASTICLQAREGGLTVPLMGEGAWGPAMLKGAGPKNSNGAVYHGVRPYVMWDEKHTEFAKRLYKETHLWLNNWFWHGYDPTKIVLWAMEKANSLDPREVIRAIPAVAEERAKELMIRPQGSIVTKSKGVFLKIPHWVGKFNSFANFMTETALVPVSETKYRGFPGWMPANWEGYTANPKDPKVNWYPTMSQLLAMRKAAGEVVAPTEL